MTDLYDVLGVPRDATQDEIKAAGRKKVKATHPDHGGDPETFHKITQALTVLRNPERREHYDRTADTGEDRTDLAEDQLVMSLLSQQLAMIVASEEDPRHIDVPSKMREMISAIIVQMTQEQDVSRRRAARISEFRSRLSTSDLDDALSTMLSAQEQEHVSRAAKIQDIIALHQKALIKVNAYTYARDPAPQPARQFYRFSV